MSQLQLGGFMLLAWYFCSQAQQQLTDLADVEDALHQSHGSSDEVSGEHMAQIKEQVVEELVTVKRRRRSGSTSTPSEILVPKKASPARTRSATRKATPKKTAYAIIQSYFSPFAHTQARWQRETSQSRRGVG